MTLKEEIGHRLRLLVEAVNKKNLENTKLFLDDMKSHIDRTTIDVESEHLREFFGQGLMEKLVHVTKSSHWKAFDCGSKQELYKKVCEVMHTFHALGVTNYEVAKVVGLKKINPVTDHDLVELTNCEDKKNICLDAKLSDMLFEMGWELDNLFNCKVVPDMEVDEDERKQKQKHDAEIAEQVAEECAEEKAATEEMVAAMKEEDESYWNYVRQHGEPEG